MADEGTDMQRWWVTYLKPPHNRVRTRVSPLLRSNPRVPAVRTIIFSQTFPPQTQSLFHGKESSALLKPRVSAEERRCPRRTEKQPATGLSVEVSVGCRHWLCQLCTVRNGSGQGPSLLIILLPTSPLPKRRNNPKVEEKEVAISILVPPGFLPSVATGTESGT